MKKVMIAAMAALAITGCSQSEEFDAVSQNGAIGFNTIVSKTTRAAITDLGALEESGFTVNAYTSPTEIVGNAFPATFGTLMDDEKVTFDTGWKTTKEYYWPLNDKVHFYAFATVPGAEYVDAAASKHPGLTYTVADDAAKQIDLVVAKLENIAKSDNAIGLAFTHALTQVNFSAQGEMAGFTYTVNSIKIVNVAKTGTYSFETGAWTAGTEVMTSYDYPINDANITIDGTTAKPLDVTGNTLMLMPQAMNSGAKIVVAYSVSNSLGLVYETPSEGFEVKLDEKATWGAGKKIRYTLTLGNGAVSMKFAPTVGTWGEPEVPGL